MYCLTFSQTYGNKQQLYTYWWPSISIIFQGEMSLVMFDLTQSKKRGPLIREGEFFFTKTVSFSWFFALSLWRHDQVPAKHQFDQNSHRQAALRAPSQTSDNGEVFQQKYFSSLRHIFAKKTLTFVGFFVLYKWMKGETMIGIEGPPTSQGQRCLLRLICCFKPWDVEQAPLVLLVVLVLQVLLVLLMPFFFW